MRFQITAGLVVAAAAIGFTATSASAVNRPGTAPQLTSVVTKAKCIGFRVNYSSFSQCMRANPRSPKHCNKICA